ncbi:hypothetical protein SYNPS1DRAFT_27138 [Syncephalis pseudoplumigaleata]|uniref:Intimal thickness related receptor IRP domain-containing protein n=1 Tax=Syncephalis pseudoplumigaleata TaxID=1712513 RepID=A0A4P9Z6A7_9FUNG|nr:hypothetical protein SYNPS1DRAFT_27138 [Syncephalis pseudoplumigaleata]|eukprot:RKP27200.1 hypothetical protein SYNPS1DRAFT_27138 [Syncephalis pseudoplumigaleata]
MALFLLMGLVQLVFVAALDLYAQSAPVSTALFVSNDITGTGLAVLFLLTVWFRAMIPKDMADDKGHKHMLYRLMGFLLLALLCVVFAYLKYFIHPFLMLFYHLIALVPPNSLDEFEDLSAVHSLARKHGSSLAYPFAHHGTVPSTAAYLPTIDRASSLRMPASTARRLVASRAVRVQVDADTSHRSSSAATVVDCEAPARAGNEHGSSKAATSDAASMLSADAGYDNYTFISNYEAMESDDEDGNEAYQPSPAESIEATSTTRPATMSNVYSSTTTIHYATRLLLTLK